MDPRASDMAVARIAAARLHMARADDAMGELYWREICNSTDAARIAELRQIIAFELRQTFLIAANADLFKPPQNGAALAPSPAVAPEPDDAPNVRPCSDAARIADGLQALQAAIEGEFGRARTIRAARGAHLSVVETKAPGAA